MTADSSSTGWSVQLPRFEGPLDLLLHLCQKHELNVLDIPVAFVTEKYLEYLAVMQLMQLDLAAEYLVMAATLAHIKSRMLLPAAPSDPDDETDFADEMDPREALIKRLLEYQKYKHAAEELAARGVAGRDVFGRGMPVYAGSGDPAGAEARAAPPLAEIPVFALVEAFQRVLDRSKEIESGADVVADRISLGNRIEALEDILQAEGPGVADPVRMYLREIGRVPLLKGPQEISLAERIQAGDREREKAQHNKPFDQNVPRTEWKRVTS